MAPTKALKLVGLVRVSSAKQAGEDGEGMERQREAIRAMAKAHNAADHRIIELPGVHGYSVADTSEWTAVVGLLKQGWCLALDTMDRLLRAEDFDFRVYQDVQAAGALIYTPAGIQDLSEPQGALFSTILGAFGGFNRHALLRQMHHGKIQARKRGGWAVNNKHLPTGCTFEPKSIRWGVNEETARGVRDAFEAVAGGRSVLSVARACGVSSATIIHWVRNPIYRGFLPSKFGTVDLGVEVQVYGGEGQADPIVAGPLWYAANRRLDESRNDSRKRRDQTSPMIWASSYLFSAYEKGEVLDPSGPRHVLYGRTRGAIGTVAYLCRCCYPQDPRLPTVEKCGLRILRADRVNAALDKYLTDLTHDPSTLESVKSGLKNKGRDTVADKARIAKGLKEQDRLEVQYVDLFTAGQMSRSIYDAKYAGVEKTRSQLKAELIAIESEPVGPTSTDLTAMAKSWAWDSSWTPDQKRAWLAKYTPGGIRVSHDGIDGLSLRVPTADGGISYPGTVGNTWEGLIGISALAIVKDPKQFPAGTIGTEEVARILNVEKYNIIRAIGEGRCPRPIARSGRHLAWTPAEVEVARSVLVRST